MPSPRVSSASIRNMAAEHNVVLSDHEVDAIVDDPSMREVVSRVAYAHDLLRRMKGIAAGPAALALWRGFAWTETGSPKKGFRLSADAILESEKRLCDAVRKKQTG